jgi:hypothetical protein
MHNQTSVAEKDKILPDTLVGDRLTVLQIYVLFEPA